jgi:hypothetical protein
MRSPTPLDKDSQIALSRRFHVEAFRGGMNRLLLRAIPTKDEPTRVEVFFQYVQHLNIPMKFSGLVLTDVTKDKTENSKYPDLLRTFPETRLYRLASGGATVGYIVAAACVFGEDSAATGTESMFPMMS